MYKNLLGKKIGSWTIIEKFNHPGKATRLSCICACGTHRNLYLSSLKSGKTLSCGCGFKNPHEIIDDSNHFSLRLPTACCKCNQRIILIEAYKNTEERELYKNLLEAARYCTKCDEC